MKKLIVRGGLVLIALVVVGVVVLYFSLNSIIKNVVQTQGSKATGVATTLNSVNLNPFAGALSLNEFDLANPEGFTNPTLFSLGEADVQIQLGTAISGDEVVIDHIYIDGAEVVVAFENGKLNVQELQRLIKENAGPADDAETPAEDEPAAEGEAKGILIKDMKITNTKVRGEISLIPGTPPVAIDFFIADIQETDFREADTGALIGYALQTIMLNATTGLADQVEGLGAIVGDLGTVGAEKIGELGEGANKAIDDAGKKLEEGLGGLLGGKKKDADAAE